jgi:polysaccharide biosynthesis protein PslH
MKLLFLAPFPPRHDALHGGGRAIAGLLSRLAERHRLGLIYFLEEGEDALDPQIKQRCEISFGVRRGSAAVARVRAGIGLAVGRPVWVSLLRSRHFRRALVQTIRAWRPDVVQAEYLVMGQYLDAASACGRVLRVHDTGISRARERWQSAQGLRRLRLRADLNAWQRTEPRICDFADRVVVFTARDRAELAIGENAAKVRVIPPGVECGEKVLDPSGVEPGEMLFFGNFSHRPNVDAAMRLVESIFPAVRKSAPETVLRIVGPSPPRELLAHQGGGVEVMGRVDSMAPWLNRAAVVCAPLYAGGGVRVKVMESLAAGKAVVATPRALEGIDALPGTEVALAETDREFSTAVVDLLRDSAARGRLAAGGRRWAERASATSRSEEFDRMYCELTASLQTPGATKP